MLQKVLALIIIVFFLAKLLWQQHERRLSWTEFFFWLIFWLLSAIAILMLDDVDKLVARLGFSGSGIDVLLYVGFALLLYLVFRLRLRLEKIDRKLTTLVSLIAQQKPLEPIQNNKTESKK